MIGIFGGTFDPIHHGHLRAALDVYEQLGLQALRFMPLGQAVHRPQPLANAEQRLLLLRQAIAGQAGFVVDERELLLPRPSYTVDSLRSLRRELGSTTPLCLLIGQDAFAGFEQWKSPDEILRLAHLVVMSRPAPTKPPSTPTRLAGRLANGADDLIGVPSGRVLFMPVTALDISSSDIRRRLREGRSIRYLVPEPVRLLLEEWRPYA